jgi:hypothetical protein
MGLAENLLFRFQIGFELKLPDGVFPQLHPEFYEIYSEALAVI